MLKDIHQKANQGKLLGILPLFPLVSLVLAWSGIKGIWAKVPIILKWALACFAISQLLAALFTENILFSAAVAMIRAFLICGLVLYGIRFAYVVNLKYIAWGLVLVSILALVVSVLTSDGQPLNPLGKGIEKRPLEFLYMTSNSISVLGVFMIWLGCFQIKWQLVVRVFLVCFGGLIAFLGAGQAAWVALFVGFLAAWIGRVATIIRLLLMLILLGCCIHETSRNRMIDLLGPAMSGRETVWENAAHIAQAYPLGGSGPYQYGYFAAPFQDRCNTLETLEKVLPDCPRWLEQLNQPWLIAHNGTLHALAETGMVGTVGWFILWGVLAFGIWRSRWPFVRAVLGGLLAINLLDNVLLVPSPGFAEIFFVLSGAAWVKFADQEEAVRESPEFQLGTSAILGGMIGLGSLVVPYILGTPQQFSAVQVNRLLLPSQYEAKEVYAIYADIDTKEENAYISLEQCSSLNICQRIGGAVFQSRRFADWIHARIIDTDEIAELRITLTHVKRVDSKYVLEQWKVRRVQR